MTQTLTLLLLDDTSARTIVAESDVVTVLLELLSRTLKEKEAEDAKAEATTELPKWVSTVLLTLDSLAQLPLTESPAPAEVHLHSRERYVLIIFQPEKPRFESFLTESQQKQALDALVEIMKRSLRTKNNAESLLLAVLQLCSRLTRHHTLSMQLVQSGGLDHLLNLPLPTDKNSRYVQQHSTFFFR